MNLTNPNPYAAENAPMEVCISLSRRNLIALLDLLDDPYAPGAILRKRMANDFVLHVRAEENDDHYGPTDQERDEADKLARDRERNAEAYDAADHARFEDAQEDGFEDAQEDADYMFTQNRDGEDDEIYRDDPDENGYENYPTEDDDDC